MKRQVLAMSAAVMLAGAAAAQDDWIVDSQTSPVTGMRTVLIGTIGYVPGPYGRGSTQFLLAVRCRPLHVERGTYQLDALIELGQHTATSGACMHYKIDDNPPVEECGMVSDNLRGYFVRYPDRFAKSLVGKSRLAMEIPTHGSGRVVATFNVGGLGKKLEALKPQCERELR